MYTVRELFTEALLSIPAIDKRLTLHELQKGAKFADRGGVYIYYNIHHEPLYVGISNSLYRRVPEHISSSKGNKDLVHYIASGKYVYADVFYEDEKMYQEVYESYLIHQLNPRFNVQKTGREKI
jgi:excinuclease UvrABC nuclease subunit